MLRDIPSFGLYVGTYEYLVDVLHGSDRGDVSGTAAVVAGGVAGKTKYTRQVNFVPCVWI